MGDEHGDVLGGDNGRHHVSQPSDSTAWTMQDPLLAPQETEPDYWSSSRLSIDLIRQHTKTSDTPGVTDEQLLLYRGSALEAAERYTRLKLTSQWEVVESVAVPRAPMGRKTFKHKLGRPASDGVIVLYGPKRGMESRTVQVPLNATSVLLPIRLRRGTLLTYKTGYSQRLIFRTASCKGAFCI